MAFTPTVYFAIFAVCCVGVVVARSASSSMRYGDFLMKNNRKRATTMRLGKYSFKNCGDPKKEMFNIESLVLGPDPISFPGTITVSFSGKIQSDVDGALKAVVLLQKKGVSTYTKIPCIGSIGSCTYYDLCELLSVATCPLPFIEGDIPCKCPFKKGSYKLPPTSFEVDAVLFPAGDYHASANLTLNGNLVTCVELQVTLD